MRKLTELYKEAPGTFGTLLSYIDNKLPAHLPHISIPAALSLLAVLKSKRLHIENYTFPALFTCVIGTSGSGKTTAHHVIEDLLERTGLHSLQGGEPGSDSGCLKSIARNPRQLILWDELGIALSALSQSKNSHEARILSVLMQIYSKTGRSYIGKEFSTLARTDIKDPHVTIFGASTSVRFFGAINENFIHDGLLPRWLSFFQDEQSALRKPSQQEPDPSLIEYLLSLEVWEPKAQTGNLGVALNVPECKPLILTPEAAHFHASILKSFGGKRERSKNPLESIFLSRAIENYKKVLLCVAEADKADIDHVCWASELVEAVIGLVMKNCEACITPSSKMATKERFAEIIKPGEKITQKELTRRTWRLNLTDRERADLINTLLDAEIWGVDKEHLGDSRKKSTLYFRFE